MSLWLELDSARIVGLETYPHRQCHSSLEGWRTQLYFDSPSKITRKLFSANSGGTFMMFAHVVHFEFQDLHKV